MFVPNMSFKVYEFSNGQTNKDVPVYGPRMTNRVLEIIARIRLKWHGLSKVFLCGKQIIQVSLKCAWRCSTSGEESWKTSTSDHGMANHFLVGQRLGLLNKQQNSTGKLANISLLVASHT